MQYTKTRGRPLGPWATATNLSHLHAFWYRNDATWVPSSSQLKLEQSRTGVITVKPHVSPTPATLSFLDEYDVKGCRINASLGANINTVWDYIHPPTGAHSGWNGDPGAVPLNKTEALYQAKIRLRQKADSIAKLMTSVAEFPETVKMVGGFANHLTGAHNKAMVKINRTVSVRRMTKQTPATIARFVADSRLAYSLGIKPAVQDAQGIGEAFAAMVENFRPMRIRAYQKEEGSYHTVVNVPPSAGMAPNVLLNIHETSKAKYEVILGGQYVHDDQSLYRLSGAEVFGISISEVGPALWELFPYSWLVDYFTNISDILDAVKNNIKLTNTWMVELNNRSYEGINFPSVPAGWTYNSQLSGYVRKRSFTFNRSAPGWTDLVPDFRLERPSWNQIANIAALSVQKLVKPVSFVFGDKRKEVLSILSSQKLR